MKKLFGLSLFWLSLIGFFYLPSPTPLPSSSETTEIQDIAPIQKVTYLDEPLTAPIP